MNIAGFLSGGEGSGGGTPLSSINQIRADFSKIRGNHTFRTGYDIQWTRFWSLSTGASVAFAPAQTGDPQTPGTGSPLASFLLGVPDSASKRATLAEINNQLTSGAYFQDQWKATSRLTANIGVRWEVGVWPIYGNRRLNTDAIGELDLNNGSYLLQRSLASFADVGAAPCISCRLPLTQLVVASNG